MPAQASLPAGTRSRPRVAGKFLWRGDAKLWLRGVTYGTFAPNHAGEPFPEPDVVRSDLAAMRANGVNTVRSYVLPPRWLLDEAARHGLLVLAGLPWEQHVAFLDDAGRPKRIEARLREEVRRIAGHPALLGFAVGNEIPGDVVRWHGRRRVERFLARLARAVKDEDPEALVTYVNFPTTEYLALPFADFVSFNVYLEDRERLEAYLARLQNLAGEKPLVMAEIGLDSRRNGADVQAHALGWQVAATFAAGCAGCYVFAWTDAWHRGGLPIDDWDFGLVDRERRPKPALAAVREAYADAPFARARAWPRATVAICSYGGARTIRDTLEGATALDYPDYEVIVVDDGSTDATAEIAAEFDVRLIRTENRGLSAARNTALRAATGEIVAYTDDDARPDPDWLRYLVDALERHQAAGVGGPNLAPAGDGLVADCVANAPGGPAHVLVDDVTAEHVPGCNMAFRRSVLLDVGGFDPRFRAAGDDVDLCWRVQDRGDRVVFAPAALVWHHRRGDVATYWRQQQGYGKAEALLEEKWPERYNALGHLRWSGVIYGAGLVQALQLLPERVYHGRWGRAPFQGVYRRPAGALELPTTPEWYLLLPPLAFVGLLGTTWPPLRIAFVLAVLAVAAPLAQAALGAARARFPDGARARPLGVLRRRLLTAALHLLQPIARLKGRLWHGLAPWRRHGAGRWSWPRARRYQVWSESWRSPEAWIAGLERDLRTRGAHVRHGGPFDRCDLEILGGPIGRTRILTMVEEHGQGRQLWRVEARPHLPWRLHAGLVAAGALAAAALASGASLAAAGLLVVGLAPTLVGIVDLGVAQGALTSVFETEPVAAEASAHD